MAVEYNHANLGIVLASEDHSISDLSFIVESLQSLVSCAIMATLIDRNVESEPINRAREILEWSLEHRKARGRFFPEFQFIFKDPSRIPFNQPISQKYDEGQQEELNYISDNPMDFGVLIGINAWMRRELFRNDPGLYHQLYQFANIERCEHHSPLIIELGIALTVAASLPALLVFGMLKATAMAKRFDAEARIRKADAGLKEEQLKQMQIQTRLHEEILDSVQDHRQKNPNFKFSDKTIEAAAKMSTPAVSDLSSSPLIGGITFGVSLNDKSKK